MRGAVGCVGGCAGEVGLVPGFAGYVDLTVVLAFANCRRTFTRVDCTRRADFAISVRGRALGDIVG